MNRIPRSYSTIGYDYHHYNPWQKPIYPMYHYPQANYSLTSTPGVSSSLETINKTNFSRRHSKILRNI